MAEKLGMPTKFNTRMCPQVRKLALLGATDEQIADFLQISVATLNRWKLAEPRLVSALKKGKEQADAAVARSLYRRALGYKHKAVKIFADPKTGAEKIVEYVEHYPPETVACIFWLKNRRPDLWRDVKAVEHSGSVTHTVTRDAIIERLTAIHASATAGTDNRGTEGSPGPDPGVPTTH